MALLIKYVGVRDLCVLISQRPIAGGNTWHISKVNLPIVILKIPRQEFGLTSHWPAVISQGTNMNRYSLKRKK